jgi:hypothetical protein
MKRAHFIRGDTAWPAPCRRGPGSPRCVEPAGDNLFDTASLWQYFEGGANGNDAYRNCPRQLTPAGGGTVTVTLLNYAADAGGRGWYASTTPSLVNAGSRTASAAGLWHHTTQTSQAKEASTQVDIGFHYVAFCDEGPCDTDGDGLGDFFEDRDGDGLPDTGESNGQDPDTDDDGIPDGAELIGGTDPSNPDPDHDGLLDSREPLYGMNPLHPDTDGDGWPDGAEVAPDLDLYLHRYTLNVTRDFNTSPRPTVLPDATMTMTWQHHAAGTLFRSGNRSECLPLTPPPPPETIRTEGDDYAWPGTGSGTRRYWKTTYGNSAKQYDPPVEIDRPPSAEINVPWERCTAFELLLNPPTFTPPFTGRYTRSASAIVHLQSVAPTWPKPLRSVVLHVAAKDKTDGGDLNPGGTGYGLGEPVQGDTGVDIDPAVTDVFVDTHRTGPTGAVLIQLNKVDTKEVTPQINVPWYRYTALKSLPRPITLTWSRHHDVCQDPDLQTAFEDGFRRLADDDDLQGSDDIQVGVEVFILPAKRRLFPEPLRGNEYFEVMQERMVLDLLDYTFANIKVVFSMQYYSSSHGLVLTPVGVTLLGLPTSVLVHDAPPVIAVHEWGHMAGCDERFGAPRAIMNPSLLMGQVSSAVGQASE